MDESIDIFRIRMHAKINLALAVGQAEPSSGLHPICSWMHAIELADQIKIHRLPEGQESSYAIGWAQRTGNDKPVEWSIQDDLAACAHKAIQSHLGRILPVEVQVSKSIPAGGGLGGGSANAAGVLMGMNELFDLELGHRELVEVAMTLGSDIPFFLNAQNQQPQPAIVEGFGDLITRLSPRRAGTELTLILPSFGCHTGKVYRAFDEIVEPAHGLQSELVYDLAMADSIDSDGLFNDLTAGACAVALELGDIQVRLAGLFEQRVHVSGSGSTLFVLADTDEFDLEDGYLGCRYVKTRLC